MHIGQSLSFGRKKRRGGFVNKGLYQEGVGPDRAARIRKSRLLKEAKSKELKKHKEEQDMGMKKEELLQDLEAAHLQCAEAVVAGTLTCEEYTTLTGKDFTDYCRDSYQARMRTAETFRARVEAVTAAAKEWLSERVQAGQLTQAAYQEITGEDYAAESDGTEG